MRRKKRGRTERRGEGDSFSVQVGRVERRRRRKVIPWLEGRDVGFDPYLKEVNPISVRAVVFAV